MSYRRYRQWLYAFGMLSLASYTSSMLLVVFGGFLALVAPSLVFGLTSLLSIAALMLTTEGH